MSNMKDFLEHDGFEIIDNFITETEICEILNELKKFNIPNRKGGIRNAEKKIESIAKYSSSLNLLKRVKDCLNGGNPNLVRAIFFNKSDDNNWLVPWHQDRTVSVTQRFEKSGWGPWSTKDGTLHVQPPLNVLNQIVTFRIHLDASTKENGCLKVLPGTHKLGIMKQKSIDRYIKENTATHCIAPRGSVLIMRPHLLHASSKGTEPSQRRVLHLEYSDYCLPKEVMWA